MGEFVRVAKADELAPGQGKLVEVGEKLIALFNIDGSFHAIDDTCTHMGGPLSEGELEGTPTWHLYFQPLPERVGHRSVRHAKGVEGVGVVRQHSNATINPLGGNAGEAQQLLCGLVTLAL